MSSLGKLKFNHNLKKVGRKILRKGPTIKSENVKIGKNVIFGKNVTIYAKNLVVGDGCRIGDNVRVMGDSFEVGDYGVIYHGCSFPGGNISIGHNFWLGNNSIIDGRAGTTIGNNVGIGAQSQLWTHMMYGDLMNGCRFHSKTPLIIGDDVWLTGHNLVSPVTIEDRSMAMLGSLVTKGMKADRTYAGSPAKDMTEKLGPQFQEISINEKKELIEMYLNKFCKQYALGDYKTLIEIKNDSSDRFTKSDKIEINLANRTYKKKSSVLEYHLMRFLLPDIKLLPL